VITTTGMIHTPLMVRLPFTAMLAVLPMVSVLMMKEIVSSPISAMAGVNPWAEMELTGFW